MILSVKNLSVNYGLIPAVRNLSMEVAVGETVALIGANGAGKTTILRAISGLIKPASGSVVFDGQDIANVKPHLIVRRGMSHVPERRGIFANLTVYENLLMGAYTRKLLPGDLDEVYSLFPRLAERKKQVAGTLSGGEQQMLAISRALLSRPKLMLLDEPSLGLAPQITKSIFETIQRINKSGTTVLLVEQNAQAALKIAHRGYVLEVGEITFADSSQKLLNNDAVKKAYLGEH
ncbi:MAG: ABC transporter ATP-binding protein [Deltaproteobacteria bacterium]